MPEIRPIRPEELDAVAALFNNAYRIGLQTARGWTDGLPPEETIAVVEEDRVASFVRMVRYNIWVGGGEMQMGGVGGVSTWADIQGKGYAGQLMRRSIQIMRDRGDAVSALYPFSHRYYGKFGWESMADKILYTDVQQSNFIPYEERLLVRCVQGEKAIGALDSVYREFAQRYNGMVIRTRANWERRVKSLEGDRGQIYLIEKDGKAIGYFFCENQPAQPWGYESITRDYAFAAPEACKAMLGFFSTLPTNVVKITIAAPAFPPLVSHFKEPFFTMKWSAADSIQGSGRREGGCGARIRHGRGGPGHCQRPRRLRGLERRCLGNREAGGGKGPSAPVQPPNRKFNSRFSNSRVCSWARWIAPVSRARASSPGSPDLARRLDGLFRDQPVYIMDAF